MKALIRLIASCDPEIRSRRQLVDIAKQFINLAEIGDVAAGKALLENHQDLEQQIINYMNRPLSRTIRHNQRAFFDFVLSKNPSQESIQEAFFLALHTDLCKSAEFAFLLFAQDSNYQISLKNVKCLSPIETINAFDERLTDDEKVKVFVEMALRDAPVESRDYISLYYSRERLDARLIILWRMFYDDNLEDNMRELMVKEFDKIEALQLAELFRINMDELLQLEQAQLLFDQYPRLKQFCTNTEVEEKQSEMRFGM